MSGTTNESEDGMVSKYQSDSPLLDDGSGGSSGCGAVLKKGPWTSSEDSILIQYVKTHGEGNWNAVQKHSGLSRCGKSCRLRWANHLRPNLKKGAISAEEEQMILELHAKMGNKWARMASFLPGRTDNEIKNYWNTRVKRRQRAGLPLYPAEILQVLQENQQGQSTGASEDLGQHGSLQGNDAFDIPEVVFEGLNRNIGAYSYLSEFSDPSVALLKSTPQCYGFVPQTFHHRQKRLRESSNVFSDAIQNSFPTKLDQFQSVASQKIAGSFGASFPQDLDVCQGLPAFDAAQGVHSLPNGNLSASGPINGPVKLELPSLQYNTDTDLCGWETSLPPPLFDSVDAYIQSPVQTGALEFDDCDAPHNSGLLDAVFQPLRHLSSVKKHSSEDSSNSSTFTHGDMISGDGIFNIGENDWEGLAADPTTPSFMNNVARSGETVADNTHVKSELVDTEQTPESKKPTNNFRPDVLLGSDWIDRDCNVAEALASFICGGQGIDYNDGAGSGSSSSSQEWGYGRCEWNSMPSAVFMSNRR